MKVWIESNAKVGLTPELNMALTTLITQDAKSRKKATDMAGPATYTTGATTYTGTIMVAGSAPDITFRISSSAPAKAAPSAKKAEPKKAAVKKAAPKKAAARK